MFKKLSLKGKSLAVLLIMALSVNAQDIRLSSDPVLGDILTDETGNVLYLFTKDLATDDSNCSGGCSSTWPTFYVSNPTTDAGLDINDFGTITRSSDGQMQTTYKGWPLYYFMGDTDPGDTNGEAVNKIWFVAKPDYSIMLLNDILIGNDGTTYDTSYVAGTAEELQFFTDAYGNTLYTWMNDSYDTNNFTASDFGNNTVWPVYEETLQQVPSVLDKGLFNNIDVYGRTQLTYKGWPLYYFGQDAQRGDTKGVSVPSPGVWPVAKKYLSPATVSGIQSVAAENTNIFPNPSDGTFTVSSDETIKSVRIYNALGQTVNSIETQHADSTEIKLLATDPGIYFVRVIKSDNNASFHTIIIK